MKIGAPPTKKQPNGSPLYTLPVIFDDSTGVVIADSFHIAEYLDATYPETLRLFPPGTKALQTAFITAFLSTLRSVVPFVGPKTPRILNSTSRAYYVETRFGSRKVEVPEGEERDKQWEKVKSEFGVLDGWMQKEGPFIMGRDVTFADIVIASYLIWMRTVLGEDSPDWYEINGWFVGRWDIFLGTFEGYKIVPSSRIK